MRSLLSECTGKQVSVVMSCLGNMVMNGGNRILYDDSITDETPNGVDGWDELFKWSLHNTDPLRYIEAVYQVGDFQVGVAKNYGREMCLPLQVAESNFYYSKSRKCFTLIGYEGDLQFFPFQRAALGSSGMHLVSTALRSNWVTVTSFAGSKNRIPIPPTAYSGWFIPYKKLTSYNSQTDLLQSPSYNNYCENCISIIMRDSKDNGFDRDYGYQYSMYISYKF